MNKISDTTIDHKYWKWGHHPSWRPDTPTKKCKGSRDSQSHTGNKLTVYMYQKVHEGDYSISAGIN